MQDILVLRPSGIHCGTYKRKQCGYRVKNGAFKVNLSEQSVAQKVSLLVDPVQKQWCTTTYNVLIHSSHCSHKKFIDFRELISGNERVTIFQLFQLQGIECAGHSFTRLKRRFHSAKHLETSTLN